MKKKCKNIWSCQKKAVPLHPLLKGRLSGAVVQLVRIPACHAVGREFESRPHRRKGFGPLLFKTKGNAPSGGADMIFLRLTGTPPGPLAQLNRVPHYGCGGCRFESCMDHRITEKSEFREQKGRPKGRPFCVPCRIDAAILLFFLFLFSLRPVEIFLPHQAETLNSGSLAQGVLIHGMRIPLESPLTVFGQ